ncbi:MAG: hypothetical protein JSU66_12120 [Deltaproteobacteria bacterium]|nr:MAG: hypothetical protein JSU66_12120 [Deltaproteobacteria bacterium]
MTRIRRAGLASLFALAAPLAAASSEAPDAEAPEPAQVSYFRQAIAETDDQLLRLYGGSWWMLSRPKLASLADVIVIVLADERRGSAYMDGEQIPIEHVRGDFEAEKGRLSTISTSVGTGAVIELADGSRWSIPRYDQARSGSWSRDDPVLVTESQHYLINLRSAEKIWATRQD